VRHVRKFGTIKNREQGIGNREPGRTEPPRGQAARGLCVVITELFATHDNGKRQQQDRMARMGRMGRIEKMTASASGSASPGPNE
jgi:hypothetical protein